MSTATQGKMQSTVELAKKVVEAKPLDVSYDMATDTVMIDGTRWHGDIFRKALFPRTDRVYVFEREPGADTINISELGILEDPKTGEHFVGEVPEGKPN